LFIERPRRFGKKAVFYEVSIEVGKYAAVLGGRIGFMNKKSQ
jgi:hypothetical protein